MGFSFGESSARQSQFLEEEVTWRNIRIRKCWFPLQWAAEHLNDPKVRFIEVDVDTTGYDQGHIPGAVGWNWQTQLQDNVRRDLIQKSALEELLGKSGVSNDTTILLYGDNNNWFAAYAFWQLKYYGHKDVRLINGGRKKWIAENRPLTTEASKVTPSTYRATGPDESIRARKEQIFSALENEWHKTRRCALGG